MGSRQSGATAATGLVSYQDVLKAPPHHGVGCPEGCRAMYAALQYVRSFGGPGGTNSESTLISSIAAPTNPASAHSSLTRSSRSGLFAGPPAEVLPFQPVHRKLAAAERWSTIRVVLNTGASTSGPEAAAACHSCREVPEQVCPRIGL